VAALAWHPGDGLTLAAGTSSGHVILYDLRAARPRLARAHGYGAPLRALHFHTANDGSSTSHVIAADAHIIKLWDPATVRRPRTQAHRKGEKDRD
jgi:ribosome biogenesis protein ENP2